MNHIQSRFLLFLVGCMGTRSAFAAAAAYAPSRIRWIMAWLALLPAIGFTWIYLTNSRKTGPEVFGATIWWNSLRPVHAALWFSFAYSVLVMHSRSAWRILAVDTGIGLVSFLVHHARQGNFRKLYMS